MLGFVSPLPHQPQPPTSGGHMVVCGDDALARRLAVELRYVYGERVTLLLPPGRDAARPELPLTQRARAAALFGRMSAAMNRNGTTGGAGDGDTNAGVEAVRIMEAHEPSDDVLEEAGVERAAALALVYDDDELNIRAALTARRLNPRLRLVIRLYNRKLGQHLETLLDQAAALAMPGMDPEVLDASTTVLSDADTAAPALAATAVTGSSKVIQAEGLLLRAAERTPPRQGELADPGLCTLALLSSTTHDPAGSEGSDSSGDDGPQLLPDHATVAAATGRGTVVLEAISHAGPDRVAVRMGGRGAPLSHIFSRRLRWSALGVATAAVALAVASVVTTGDSPLHAAYLTLLDLLAMGDPAEGEPPSRQVIQLLSGMAGLLLLPLLVAAVLEAFGSLRNASSLRRPPRGLSGHVVLLGLGKIGTRVLVRLRELEIPVVVVEEDPEARGIPLARSMHVPTVIGDVTQEGVLEAAKIRRAHALLALTSIDTTNLEATLYARSVKPDLQVALRLYDDEFATAVFRTLRTAHPQALTRSRSVSHLAAPSFAVAMMGRQILGAVPVERKVMLFAALEVGAYPQLVGRTVEQAFRAGAWRVLALDATPPADRRPDLAAVPPYDPSAPDAAGRSSGLVWNLHPGYVLRAEDRVVIAATRRGLAELLRRQRATTVR
ncbi:MULTISPECIES: NAD(P)-binding protein [unclassified Streptomyces]|uniref:NAD(P)-binding protein n=1 Tax=unclassified Streptomyces TaxID=2593676 RepID=UPI0003A19987|nr:MULTISPECIES: NAD(P)-binding protein [unclassified Streptomyces]MYR65902.1 potassium transporter TrkA [Streptomyces sp. SID4939]MYS04395.1 potassium transporter TrkA [Streptomyces sp. SID4940]MYT63665.1 potassium transporter TrkA [Streptomyces sp. SID8357]MYT85915.1 potassium transporter TrkA [Streptomyces sp. SID8360]MYU33107.1 potassium transporter TrkA [Streptomyces sp. SID8358]